LFILFFILVFICSSFLFIILVYFFVFSIQFFLVHSSRIWIFDLNTVHKWHCRIRKVIFHDDFLLIFVDLFTLLECCFDYLLLFFFGLVSSIVVESWWPRSEVGTSSGASQAKSSQTSVASCERSAFNWFHHVINLRN